MYLVSEHDRAAEGSQVQSTGDQKGSRGRDELLGEQGQTPTRQAMMRSSVVDGHPHSSVPELVSTAGSTKAASLGPHSGVT